MLYFAVTVAREVMITLWIMRCPKGLLEYKNYNLMGVTHDENNNRNQRKDS